MDLSQLLGGSLFGTLAIFARIGTAAFILPGIGDASVPTILRIAFALGLSIAVGFTVLPGLPQLPGNAPDLGFFLAREATIGLFIGLVARILFTALAIAGEVLAFLIGLSNAQLFNPLADTSSPLPGLLLSMFGLLLLFVTDLHHMLIRSLVESYRMFPFGASLPLDDLAQTIGRVTADAFTLGVQLAAPFIIVGVLAYFGIGLLSRLMPQMQLLNVAISAQIMGGLVLFLAVSSAMLLTWRRDFAQLYMAAFGNGG